MISRLSPPSYGKLAYLDIEPEYLTAGFAKVGPQYRPGRISVQKPRDLINNFTRYKEYRDPLAEIQFIKSGTTRSSFRLLSRWIRDHAQGMQVQVPHGILFLALGQVCFLILTTWRSTLTSKPLPLLRIYLANILCNARLFFLKTLYSFNNGLSWSRAIAYSAMIYSVICWELRFQCAF